MKILKRLRRIAKAIILQESPNPILISSEIFLGKSRIAALINPKISVILNNLAILAPPS